MKGLYNASTRLYDYMTPHEDEKDEWGKCFWLPHYPTLQTEVHAHYIVKKYTHYIHILHC